MKSEKPSADSDQSPGEKPADIKQVKAEPEEKPLKKADAKHLVTEAGDKQEPGQEPVVSSSKGSKVIKKKITGQPAKILPPVKADTSDIAKKTKPSEKPAAPEIKATKPEPEKKSVSAPLAKKTVADEKDKAQKPVASSPKSQKAPAEPVARTDTDIKPEQTDASEKIKPAKSARADKKTDESEKGASEIAKSGKSAKPDKSPPDLKIAEKKDKMKKDASEIVKSEKSVKAEKSDEKLPDFITASLGRDSKRASEDKSAGKSEEYNPKGKVDPFEPLFKEEKGVTKAELEKKAKDAEEAKKRGKKQIKRIKKRTPRTPLERVDLSQLKLVGIIHAESGNRALVEEASGKGYIINEGTYIGIHEGKVSEILRDRVIVEEEDEDFSGEITIRKRELKLQKPFGEELL
ncbi:pilus assembly protein PilP [Desulfonema magnum]|nr:pilus assembly protein PilP [Desulfonema magnum]